MSEQWDLEIETERIDNLFSSVSVAYLDYTISKSYFTLTKFVSKYCFDDWNNRGRCINIDDYLGAIKYDDVLCESNANHEDFLTLVEIVYNFWKMAEKSIANWEELYATKNFFHLQKVLNDSLSHYNHKAVYDEKTEQLIVIEDKPEVTAVAEIVDPELSISVMRYNHRTLRGELEKKKAILNQMCQEIEPRRKELKNLNSKLEDNLFYLLNNLHIRHNNKDDNSKSYKAHVANMNDDELESWYDEVYQMALLAILELDQIERNARCKTLRDEIQKMHGS